jgi:hypothetical protein
VQLRDLEGSISLSGCRPARFASDAVEPALDAAAQAEIGGIDGKDERSGR